MARRPSEPAADRLACYRARRDFERTAEPAGIAAPARGGRLRYLVQKHAATRLHYDFRLELDGVLKSWAVTRGPSLDPAERRLAVQTEDHPLDYADFEGTIPAGQYGGGTVMLWDEGWWEPVQSEDAHAGLEQGHLHFRLHGERLCGEWLLVRMRPRDREKSAHWLLRKVADAESRAGSDVLATALDSVRSGRTMAEIAAGAASPAAPRREWALPRFRPPQLATLVEAPPDGSGWVHEIKYDGYRIELAVAGDQVRAYTRGGQDWAKRFPGPVADAAGRGWGQLLLDGEMVVLDDDGRSRFHLLQQALGEDASPARRGAILYFAFDLLERDGADLSRLPLIARKEQLRALLGNGAGAIRYCDHLAGNGPAMLAQACGMRLEGIVSKRADSFWASGRSRDWLKTKCTARQEFLIVGWLPSAGGKHFRSLLLGTRGGDGRLVYAGKVGTGFDASSRAAVAARLEALPTAAPLEAPAAAVRGAHWVAPRLVAEVAYAEVTSRGILRHASFLGLRDDKPAADVVREQPVTTTDPPALPAITHPDRLLFPEAGITKGELAGYYRQLAGPFLDGARRRLLSLVRCPEGRAKACFFQRHPAPGFGAAVHRWQQPGARGEVENYLYIADAAGLLACVQMGVIEFHGWGATVDRPDHPDRLVFDLDPDEGLGFDRVRSAAFQLRDELANLGLASYACLSGGKGVHVIVPLDPAHSDAADWPRASDFASRFARALAAAHPDRYTAELRKVRRRGRIFIDYLRNQPGATAILPLSARARPGAPVAAPIQWDELPAIERSNHWTVRDAAELLQRAERLAGWGRIAQHLPDR
jgi:bifunctional non-homologous end joining protein LigD